MNVVIFRYNPEFAVFSSKKIGGRSRCRHCSKTLGALELIPVLSFLAQGGRCRTCKKQISFQYPLVEILSGLIFVVVPIFLSRFYNLRIFLFEPLHAHAWFYAVSAVWILIFLVWLLIAAIDVKEYIIPNELNLILGGLGCIFVLIVFYAKNYPFFKTSFLGSYEFLFSFTKNIFLNHLAGALLGVLFFGIFAYLSQGRAMGFGDVKLALAAGLLFGLPDMGLAIILSFIFGGIYGLFTILSGRKKMKDKLPFGPFLILGSVLTFFGGFQIVSFYFRLFQI